MKKHIFSLITILLFAVASVAQSNPPPHNPPYPTAWWEEVTDENTPDWEILPQEAAYGEVILSKRNELGILSNFAPTPFTLDGKRYASMEGFWQSTKFPEDKNDPRAKFKGINWPHTRDEVAAMTAFEAKRAGDIGSTNMKKMGIDWVSYHGKRMTYKEEGESAFYKLVLRAMKEKLNQNVDVKNILLRTDNLILKPDHHQKPGAEKLMAWQYHSIWMQFRDQGKKKPR